VPPHLAWQPPRTCLQTCAKLIANFNKCKKNPEASPGLPPRTCPRRCAPSLPATPVQPWTGRPACSDKNERPDISDSRYKLPVSQRLKFNLGKVVQPASKWLQTARLGVSAAGPRSSQSASDTSSTLDSSSSLHCNKASESQNGAVGSQSNKQRHIISLWNHDTTSQFGAENS